MDWKRHYAGEWTNPQTPVLVEEALDRAPGADPEVDAALAGGGAVSFPHTYLAASAPMLARVVRALARVGARRVLALGVLHGGTAPEPWRGPLTRYRAEVLADGAGPDALRAIFERHGPAYAPPGPVATRFGELPRWEIPGVAAVDGGILAGEFSLDNFLNVLALNARWSGVPPPAVLPLYVGLTVSPSGGGERAAALAAALREALRPGDAVVATGDVVHYGAFYGGPESVRTMPDDPDVLTAHFRTRVEAMHAAAFAGDIVTATRIAAHELRSDQLFMLPVLAALLGSAARSESLAPAAGSTMSGPTAGSKLLEFALSDYAAVLETPPPCFVASALTAMVPAGR